MPPPTPRRPAGALLAFSALALCAAPARAYVRGTGTLASDGFDDGDDAGWETVGSSSKWTVASRAGSNAYLADGRPDIFRGLPEASRLPFIAVPPGSVDLCFGLTTPLGAGWEVRAELRPPKVSDDFYRLLVAPDGHAEIQLVRAGAPTQLAATRAGAVAAGVPTWLHVQLRPGAAGATAVSLRSWTGGASAEPARWDATGVTPGAETIPYVQRLELTAVQPAGETVVDDVDLWGDTSAGVLSSVDTVWIMEGSHLDIGFTKPPDDIEAFAKTHLDEVLANLRADAAYQWNIESCWQLLRWMERSTPAEIAEMTSALQSGRVHLMAGYANLHTTLTTREELVRALSFSHELGRANGFPVRTFVEDDVPGATWAMPELLAGSGVPYYVGGMNCPFGGAIDAPSHADRPFWWEGPDGSRVLSWITFDSYAEGLGLYGMSFFDNLANLHEGLGKGLGQQESLGYPHANLLVMRIFDNHYQGLFVKGLVDQWNATYRTPVLRLASPEEFFDAVQGEIAAKGLTIPVYRGDFGAAWAGNQSGTAHTHATAAQARRDLQAAEPLAAAASLLGAQHPTQDIATAWRRIIETDEHSGGGAPWAGYMTPEQADRQNRIRQGYAQEASDAATRALQASLTAMTAQVDLPAGGVVAWNALDSVRTGPVTVALPASVASKPFRLVDASTGRETPYQLDASGSLQLIATDVPPHGEKAWRFLRGAPASVGAGDLRVAGSVVENAFYRVTVDPVDGSIASIVHVPTGRELVDSASPWRFGQTASNTTGDGFWGVTPRVDVPTSAAVAASEAGPLSASLVVTRTGTPAAGMTVRLWRGLDALEIVSTIDRRAMTFVPASDGARSWALTLPLAASGFDFATESPARLLHPARDGFARSSTWSVLNSTGAVETEDAAGSIVLACAESVGSEWGGISNTVPAHRTGAATLFVRVKASSNEATYAGGMVGPLDDEPGTSPLYPVTIRLRAHPVAGTESAIRSDGWDLVDPMRATWTGGASGPLPAGGRALFGTGDADARLVTVKRSEDGTALVARVEEMSGASRPVGFSSVFDLASPERTNLHEAPTGGLTLLAGVVQVPLSAYGTTTVRMAASSSLAPTLLKVRKDEAGGAVVLEWTGGVAQFGVLRDAARDLTSAAVIASALDARALRDAGALHDGATWFYDVE